MPADTRPRRPLQFSTLADIRQDVDQLMQASGSQPHTTGQLTPAQNIWHVAYFIDHAATGFPFKVPLIMRLVIRPMRSRYLRKTFNPGINPPSAISSQTVPSPETTMDEALAYLHRSIDAASPDGAMNQPSPLFGKMSHDQWVQLNCRHAEMHLSFLHAEA